LFLSIQIKGYGDFNNAKFIKMQRELMVRSEVGRGKRFAQALIQPLFTIKA
jgi:hypothetical protein